MVTISNFLGNCSSSSLMSCHGDPCETRSCPGYPNAVCEYDTCTCTARYYDQFNEVTNECGKSLTI